MLCSFFILQVMLDRIARRDIPLLMSEIEFLCYLMDEILRTREATISRYLRWRMNWNDDSVCSL